MMKAGPYVLVLALTVAACQNQASPNGGQVAPETTISDAVPAQAVDLEGEWRVAGIDGQAIDKPYAIALSIDETRIWWQPGCAAQYREYSVSGTGFSTNGDPQYSGPICTIPTPRELSEIWAVLDAAGTVERTPENGVLISGHGRSILLFSQ